jgi:hypothetical protein
MDSSSLVSHKGKITHNVLFFSFYVFLFVLCFFSKMHSTTKKCERKQKKRESGKCFSDLESFKEGARH